MIYFNWLDDDDQGLHFH